MRVVLSGGRVFDGTGAPVSEADVSFEDGRIVEVGTAIDGDEAVDVSGATLLPVCSIAISIWWIVTRIATSSP